MSLRSDEIIDALKKGNISRFVNHSCAPNCILQKWVVQNRIRMGIFTTRNILAGEELTFDYKFERYGEKAQPCYCGESVCEGVIGRSVNKDKDFDLDEEEEEELNAAESEVYFILVLMCRRISDSSQKKRYESWSNLSCTIPVNLSLFNRVFQANRRRSRSSSESSKLPNLLTFKGNSFYSMDYWF
jgi:hypothetical protein